MPTPVARLPEALRREIIEHCLRELPNEGCGLLAVDDGVVVKVYPTSNGDASPSSYVIPPQEHFDALADAEANGWSLGGVFHSHPSGPAAMSSTDMARALEPDWVYVVVGLGGDEPEVTLSTV